VINPQRDGSLFPSTIGQHGEITISEKHLLYDFRFAHDETGVLMAQNALLRKQLQLTFH
jgi:hypothetical protein